MAALQPTEDFINGQGLNELNQQITQLIGNLESLKSQAADIGQSFTKVNKALSPDKFEELDQALANTAISTADSTEQLQKLGAQALKNEKIAQESTKRYEEQAKIIADLTKQIEDLTKKLKTQRTETDKVAKLQERLTETYTDNFKEQVRLRAEIAKRTRAVKEEIATSEEQGKTYKSQVAQLRKLKNEYKDLVISQGGSTQESLKLLKVIQELDSEIKELDNSVGDFQRSVGDYKQALSGLSGQVVVLDDGLGQLAATFQVVRGGINALSAQVTILGNRLRRTSPIFDKFAQAWGRVPGSVRRGARGVGRAVGAMAVGVAAGIGSILFSTRKMQMQLQQDLKMVVNVLKQTSVSLYVLFQGIGQTITGLGGIVINAFQVLITTVQGGLKELELLVVQGLNSIIDKANDFGLGIDRIAEDTEGVTKIWENQSDAIQGLKDSYEGLTNGLSDVGDSFGNFLENIRNANRATSSYVESLFKLQDNARIASREIARLNGQVEIQNTLAGATASTLEERERAELKALKLGRELAELRITTAREQLRLSNEAIRAQLAENQAILGGVDAYSLTNAELTNIINNEQLRLDVGEKLLQAQQEAVLELIDAENALQNTIVQNAVEINQLRSDQAQIQEDYVKDLDERTRQSLINQLGNERLTFAARAALIQQLEDTFNESVDRQLGVLSEVASNRVEIEKDANGKIIGIVESSTQVRLDANALLAQSNEELAASLVDTALSEQELTQLLDILRDVISGQQEIVQARTELDRAIEERDLRVLKIRQQRQEEIIAFDKEQIANQQRTTRELIKGLDERVNSEIRLTNIRFENLKTIAALEITDALERNETLEGIEEDHQRALLRIDEEGIKTRQQLRQQAFEEGVAIGEQLVNSGLELANQLANNRKAQSDKELELLIKAGEDKVQAAGDNAAEIQQIEFNLQNESERIRREEAARERRFTLFELAAAFALAVANTAVAVTGQLRTGNIGGAIGAGVAGGVQIAAITAAIAGLPALKDGTDYFQGGLALVSDSGSGDPRELVREPSGRQYLTPDKPTVMSLPQGAQVFPDYSSETKAITGAAVERRVEVAAAGIDYGLMANAMSEAMKEQPVHKTCLDKRGLTVTVERGIRIHEDLSKKVRY